MIICSCNRISDRDLSDAVDRPMLEDPARLITVGQGYLKNSDKAANIKVPDSETPYKNDYVTMEIFEELLRDEEGHIDFLETQLELLENIGIENYGALNAQPASEED